MTALLAIVIVLLVLLGVAQWALVDYSRSRLEKRLEESDPVRLQAIFEHEVDTILTLRIFHGILFAATILLVHSILPSYFTASEVAYWPLTLILGPSIAVIVDMGIARPFGRRFAEAILDQFWTPLNYLRIAATPLLLALKGADAAVHWVYGRQEGDATASALQDEILSALNEGEREGTIFEDAADMIEGLMELHQVLVGEIMIPRPDMIMLKSNASIEEARQLINECGHSRIPVYAQSRDQVLGVLYAKDLLPYIGAPPNVAPRDISSLLLREPVYVPESKPVHALLREFQKGRVHIAIVVDEYGGVAGLVTIEDILEQIVGDIADEHDRAEPPAIRKIDELRIQVDARTPVEEINELLPINLPEDGDYETVGGFVSSILGRIPKMGDTVQHNHVRFTVLDATDRTVNHLLIELEPQPLSETETSPPSGQEPRAD